MIRLAGLLIFVAAPVSAQAPEPILDMHLHALGANDQGPAPIPVCAPLDRFPAWDQRTPYGAVFMKPPPCDDPLWSPETDEALRDQTIAVMERLNIYGVLSGTSDRVDDWRRVAPDRFIPGFAFRIGRPSTPSPDDVRRMVETGSLAVLAEVTNQYAGLAPDDPAMAPYWAQAEELDLPVGIHMGVGPPGGIYLAYPDYRASLGNPLLLEDVLARHPRLRLYIMHAGYPFLDDLLALLYAHPQVYVEVGAIVFTQPRATLYRYLRAVVDAGFEDRVMFGSDQMNWPQAIEVGVRAIEEAPFLSQTQKRAILYENAARFLRLSEEDRARHEGR